MRTTALGLCLAGCLASAPVHADIVTLSALKDNTLYQEDSGLLSNGSGAYLFAGINGRGEIRRGLIAFDVSAIPSNAVVSGVSLRMRMSRTTDGVQPVTLHRSLQNWGEGISNAAANEGAGIASAPGDATWVHSFFPATEWLDENMVSSPGGVFVAAASATANVDQIGFYNWSTAGVIADVQAWVAAPQSNFGWVIRGYEDGVSSAKRFDSRNNNTVANRPSLTVEFTIPVGSCPCDLNDDALVTSADFFDFLTAFFSGAIEADFDQSGEINSADFFAYITCFFSLPTPCA